MWLSAWPHRRPRWDFDAVLSGIPPRDKLLKHTDETYLNITKFLWLFFCPCDVRTSFEFSQIPPRIIISRQTGRFLPPSLSFAIRKEQSVLSAFRVPPPPPACAITSSHTFAHTQFLRFCWKKKSFELFFCSKYGLDSGSACVQSIQKPTVRIDK